MARHIGFLRVLAAPAAILVGCASNAGGIEETAPEVDIPTDTGSSEEALRAGAVLSVELFERATGTEVFRGEPTRSATPIEVRDLRARALAQATTECRSFVGSRGRVATVSHGSVSAGWREGLAMSQSVFVLDSSFRCSASFAGEAAVVDHLVSHLTFESAHRQLASRELAKRVVRSLGRLVDAASLAEADSARRSDIVSLLADAAAKSTTIAETLAGTLTGSNEAKAQVAFEALYGIWGRPDIDIVVRLAAMDAIARGYSGTPEALRTRVLELLDYLHPLRSPDSGFGRPELAAHNALLVAVATPELRSLEAARVARATMLLADTGETGLEVIAFAVEDATLSNATRSEVVRQLALYSLRELVEFAPVATLAQGLTIALASSPIATEGLVEALAAIATRTATDPERARDASAALARLCPNDSCTIPLAAGGPAARTL